MPRIRGEKKRQEKDDHNAPLHSPRASSINPSSVSESDWWENFSARFSGYTPDSLFKVSRKTFEYICGLVEEEMTTGQNYSDQRREYLALNDRVAIALTRLCTGESFEAVGNLFGVNISTAYQITWRFVEAIEKKGFHHLHWPKTEEKIMEIKSKFEGIRGLPNCCGAIDTTKIMFSLASDHAQRKIWCDQENNPCTILQAVVDPDMRFLDIMAGLPGCVSEPDALCEWSLFNLCEEGKRLNGKKLKLAESNKEIGEYIVGNGGFPLLPWLLTPYNEKKKPSDAQQDFNKRLYETMKVAKMAFERLKETWKIIQGVVWRPDKLRLPRIIYACCVLHNIMIDHNDGFILQDESLLQSNDDTSQAHQPKCKFLDKTASVQRDNLALYLSSKPPPFSGNGSESEMDATERRRQALLARRDQSLQRSGALKTAEKLPVPTIVVATAGGGSGAAEPASGSTRGGNTGGRSGSGARSGSGSGRGGSSEGAVGSSGPVVKKRKVVDQGGTSSKSARTAPSPHASSDKTISDKVVPEKATSENVDSAVSKGKGMATGSGADKIVVDVEDLGSSGDSHERAQSPGGEEGSPERDLAEPYTTGRLLHLDEAFMSAPSKSGKWRKDYIASLADVPQVDHVSPRSTQSLLSAHGRGLLARSLVEVPAVALDTAELELGDNIGELISYVAYSCSKLEKTRAALLEKRHGGSKDTVSDLKGQLSNVNYDLTALREHHDALAARKLALDDQVSKLQADSTVDKRANLRLTQEVSKLKTQAKELESAASATSGENANLKMELADLKKELADLKARNADLEGQVAGFDDALNAKHDAGAKHIMRVWKHLTDGARPTADEAFNWTALEDPFDAKYLKYHPELPFSAADIEKLNARLTEANRSPWIPPPLAPDNLDQQILDSLNLDDVLNFDEEEQGGGKEHGGGDGGQEQGGGSGEPKQGGGDGGQEQVLPRSDLMDGVFESLAPF